MSTQRENNCTSSTMDTEKQKSSTSSTSYFYRNNESLKSVRENNNDSEESSFLDDKGAFPTKQNVTKILYSKQQKKNCEKKYLPETDIPKINEHKKCSFNSDKILEFLNVLENCSDKTILRFYFQPSLKNSRNQEADYQELFKKIHNLYINYNVYHVHLDEDPSFKVYRKTKEENAEDIPNFNKKLYEIGSKIFMKKPNKPQKYFMTENDFDILVSSYVEKLENMPNSFAELYYLKNEDEIKDNENFKVIIKNIENFYENLQSLNNESNDIPEYRLDVAVTICEFIYEEKITRLLQTHDSTNEFFALEKKFIEDCFEKDFVENDFIFEIQEVFNDFKLEHIKKMFDHSLEIFLSSLDKIKKGEYDDFFEGLLKEEGVFKNFKNVFEEFKNNIKGDFSEKYRNYLTYKSKFEKFNQKNTQRPKSSSENTFETQSNSHNINYISTSENSSLGNATTKVFSDEDWLNIEKIHRVFALKLTLNDEIKKKFFFKKFNCLYYYCFLYTFFNDLFDLINAKKPAISSEFKLKREKIILESLKKSFKLHDFILNYMKEINGIYLPFLKDFQDNLESLFDGEFQSLLFCKKVPFLLEQNLVVHPIVLGVIRFYEKMKSYTKSDKNDPYYNDNNLPAITFINFDGYDHPNNYYFAHSFAKHLQIISITIDAKEKHCLQIQETVKSMDSEKNQKHFYFFPLRSKGLGEHLDLEFEIKDYNIMSLFDKIILKIVARHAPSLIVFSHSFVFHKTIHSEPQIRTTLKPATFQTIVAKLCLISNFRVVLYPNIQFKDENSGYALKEDNSYGKWRKQFSFSSKEDFWANRAYIYEMIGAFFNAIYSKFFFLYVVFLFYLLY